MSNQIREKSSRPPKSRRNQRKSKQLRNRASMEPWVLVLLAQFAFEQVSRREERPASAGGTQKQATSGKNITNYTLYLIMKDRETLLGIYYKIQVFLSKSFLLFCLPTSAPGIPSPTIRVSGQEEGTSKTRYRATWVRIHKPTQTYEEIFRAARVEGG